MALDIPSPHAGRVVEIHVIEGDTVDEGALLVSLEVD
ncbi:MAG: biotin/lipoyl-containing protein [Azonexus sp.]|nr:biotin/lipoyl-containing protein [Azonexus sp.]